MPLAYEFVVDLADLTDFHSLHKVLGDVRNLLAQGQLAVRDPLHEFQGLADVFEHSFDHFFAKVVHIPGTVWFPGVFASVSFMMFL